MEKNIFQIYHDKTLIPNYVKNNILQLNPGYDFYFIDFEEGKNIIKKHFEKDYAEKICNTIDILPRYCHKSDLLRYCLLYIFGGVYIDCDLKPLVPFEKFINGNVTFFTSFGRGASKFICNTKNGDKIIDRIMANGVIASKRNNCLLLKLINYSINNIIDKNPDNRGTNILFLYNLISKYCNTENNQIEPFKYYEIDDNIIYLITQYDTVTYGKNCFIDEDNNVLININDNEYCFKRQTSSFL